MSNHRAANAAGDRADARAFAGHVDRLHFDDHAAIVARRCDVLLRRHVLGGLRDHRRLGLRAGQVAGDRGHRDAGRDDHGNCGAGHQGMQTSSCLSFHGFLRCHKKTLQAKPTCASRSSL